MPGVSVTPVPVELPSLRCPRDRRNRGRLVSATLSNLEAQRLRACEPWKRELTGGWAAGGRGGPGSVWLCWRDGRRTAQAED